MTTKSYQDHRFSVSQVSLMSQLYDSGLTVDEVIAGFKQIQDITNTIPATPKITIDKSQNSHFIIDQNSYHDLSQQNYASIAPPSPFFGNSTMFYTRPIFPQKTTMNHRGVAESKARRRGRPRKHVNFTVTEEDRINFSPQVVALMETDVLDVWAKITWFMKRHNIKIKEVCNATGGVMYYSYLANWLKRRPHTNDKRRVAALYKWYAEEIEKREGVRHQVAEKFGVEFDQSGGRQVDSVSIDPVVVEISSENSAHFSSFE